MNLNQDSFSTEMKIYFSKLWVKELMNDYES